ncbi:MarR family winged helix-turn-helix transcriptional regulator [Streptomyces sp. RK75]|uniref:MarR family winged helix-turn-helix transcriptional regulator n=1 Tax=Streptomyces sp. RK75 TaxID=2824895 RepID=UPI001B384AE4|nr:MarR family transcriptional regulator [Streptomyces sp. RK75]MBQ0867778.1 MarR family transcriptional regulator [Streptomyces sp. RK75]
MDATDKPIGYWLKHLHNLLEEQFGTALEDSGVTRRQWQVLSLLGREPHSRARAAEALAPFWREAAPTGAGPADLGELLDAPEGLFARGWVHQDPETDLLALTAKGRAEHAAVAARVHELRRGVLRGLTSQQYAETVRILSVMAANIEADLADRATEPATPRERQGGAQEAAR